MAIAYSQDLIDEYTNKGYWDPKLLTADVCDRNASEFPNDEAAVDSRKRVTWAQVKQQSDRIALALLELPIMARGMDEAIAMVPLALKEASYALGANRLETALKVVLRQTGPALLTATLLAFGRGIGDTASVLFTAGFTDRLPDSLLDPAASLPLAIFFQLNTPFPAVQDRAYASALVLTLIVLGLGLISRQRTGRIAKHLIR